MSPIAVLRLRRALKVWLLLAALAALLPAAAQASVGVLATPWFWLAMVLGSCTPMLLRRVARRRAAAAPLHRRRPRRQARMRVRAA